MSRYRKVEQRIWSDEKFNELTPMPPSGQSLWLYLIIGPSTTPIPGLMKFSIAGTAEDRGWSTEATAKALSEAIQLGMAKYDQKARLLWLPKGIEHNKPESPNVVISWRDQWDLLPECDLKREAYAGLKAFISGLSEAFAEAFSKAIAKPSPKPFLKAMPNQEQEQEQEQEQKQEQEEEKAKSVPPADATGAPSVAAADGLDDPADGSAGRPVLVLVAADAPPSVDADQKSKAKAAAEAKAESKTARVWQSYSAAYREKYKVDPVRNGKVNKHLSDLIDRIGADDAPLVAAFYVKHPSAFYAQRGHSADALLTDAEKLRTEWATQRVTTATTARQIERTASNPFAAMAAEARAKEARDAA